MSIDLVLVVTAVLAVLVAGLSKGGFGAGAAFVATPLLAISVGPAAAAAILLPILVVMDVYGLRAYWGGWRWSILWPMMVASVPGVLLGWAVFGSLSAPWLSILLGGMTLVLFAYRFLSARIANASGTQVHVKPRWQSAGFWGSIAGFASFVIHAGGPPVALYLLPIKLPKRVYQSSTVLFFAFVNAIKLGPYFALGLFEFNNLTVSLWLLPLAPLAMWAGVWAHSRVSETLFYRITYSLAIIAAAKLLFDGIRALI